MKTKSTGLTKTGLIKKLKDMGLKLPHGYEIKKRERRSKAKKK